MFIFVHDFIKSLELDKGTKVLMKGKKRKMPTEKLDRRVRKTRALLTQGLIQLLREKDIRDISVKELSDLVDINRGTFYLHYSDIYDMVNKIEDDLFAQFAAVLRKDLSETNLLNAHDQILLDIFKVLNENREITRVLIGPHGDLTFVNRMKDMVKNQLETLFQEKLKEPGFEYLFAFIVSGYVGVFETWLDSDNPLSEEYISQLCANLISPGLNHFA